MIIFRILFNLFHVVTRIGFSVLWLPIFLVTRNLFLTIILIVLFMLFLYMRSDDTQTRSRDANPATIVEDAQGNKVQLATPVRRREDGDSAFANDLYKQMTPQERQLYSQTFFWVMSNVPDGQTHSWSNIDIAGSIRPGNSFNNKSGVRCRMFTEALKVHAVQQTISGMACDNGGGSWCKLRINATPACGLGHTPTFMDSISGSFGKLF